VGELLEAAKMIYLSAMWGLDDNEFAKANLIYYAMLMINHT
jgi:hypothetical protein